jgi:hypothetical protein
MSPGDYWAFEELKGILKGREFTSSEEMEQAITRVWNDLAFDHVQRVFRNWMSRLSWVIENGRENYSVIS